MTIIAAVVAFGLACVWVLGRGRKGRQPRGPGTAPTPLGSVGPPSSHGRRLHGGRFAGSRGRL